MVREEYRKRIKYALECSYELQANNEILKEEIIQDEALLRTLPTPKTTRFGSDAGGGSGFDKPSPEETFVLQQEESRKRLKEKRTRYYDQKLLLERLDKGLAQLPQYVARILRWRSGYKCRRLTWEQIAIRLEEDPSYCRRRYEEGLDVLTGIVYGAEAYPVQGVLFVDTSKDQLEILK